MRMIGRARRRGNILVIVSVLALVIFAALFGLSYLTRTDVVSSSNLLREISATTLAESIAAQIEAQVNTHPWNERFWLTAAEDAGTLVSGQPPQLALNRSTTYLDLSRESLAPGDYDFVGLVKDLPADLREYRVYLEVTVKGETYAFSWDKRWELSMLAALNRDMTLCGKTFEEVPPNVTSTDKLIETIKTTAEAAPPPDPAVTASAPVATKIGQLRKDERTFKGRAFPGGPANRPGVSGGTKP